MVDVTLDHKVLDDALEARRYFKKFAKIAGYLPKVAAINSDEGWLQSAEYEIVNTYVEALSRTFTALSYKYLMAGRVSDLLPSQLTIDRHESGFPIYSEILRMANDALQAKKHLKSLSGMQQLKQEMVHHILNEHANPTRLQFAASQRLYYEKIAQGGLFWAQNDPQAVWQGNIDENRRRYLVHWASYDSQMNLPVIYLMNLEDSGDIALLHDERRWPRVQSQLMAQAIASLKLVTIATGFDKDFDDLHPKRLQRIFIGPMYSNRFTMQSGPMQKILNEGCAEPGTDWALAWTLEELVSEKVAHERTGFFSSAEREIYKLDPFASDGPESSGLTHSSRALILPLWAYQVLVDHSPPGMSSVAKYVVTPNDDVLSYR